MILSDFIYQSTINVPFKLERIESSDSWVIGLALFVSLLLIAYAQRMEPTILKATGLAFFTSSTRDELESKDVDMTSYGYLFLTISFFFSFGVCIYEWMDFENGVQIGKNFFAFDNYASWEIILFGVVSATSILIYPFIGLFFGEWITGEHQFFAVARQQTWISLQFFSLLTFVIASVWMLNPAFSPNLLLILPYVLGFLFVTRFFKCFFVALSNGASWYYIILYFCTLEILPILFLIKWFVVVG